MDANDFAARLAVMEAALAKCGKRDTPKRDEVEWVLPSTQSAPAKEHDELKRPLPSVQGVTPKEQVEVEQPLASVQSSISTEDAREASDISIVLTARIDRLDVQLDVINDLLRSLITDQAPALPQGHSRLTGPPQGLEERPQPSIGKEKGPGSRWKAAGP